LDVDEEEYDFKQTFFSMIFAPCFVIIGALVFVLEGHNYITHNFSIDPIRKPFDHCLIAISLGVIQFFLLMFISSKLSKIKIKRKTSQPFPIEGTIIDQNTVEQEKIRVESSENNDVIKTNRIQKKYSNGTQALCNLTFGVEKGQIFCLLGPNGAGKTTTFNILSKRISKTSGEILIHGQPVSKISESSYTIGVCLQSNTLWNYLTVEQHLRIYAYVKGMERKYINENIRILLSALGLEENANKKVNELSGGSKRKLCAAIAILGGPDVIFLDEVTTGVDAIGRSKIWSLLKDIVKEKENAVILSTHYIEDAEFIADKLGNKI